MAIQTTDTKSWDEFIQILNNRISFASPWLSTLEPVTGLYEETDNGIFLIKSNQNFAIQFLQTKHNKDIENALEEYTGLKRAVRFKLDETLKPKKMPKPKEKEHIETAKKMENLAQMHSFCGLNLKYTFENFIEGQNSRLAYQVARMIAENPGQKKFNPLFISGSVGLGKTHLMQAIGHKILRNFPNLKIRYTKAEEFGNKLIEALNSNKSMVDLNEKMKKFRDMYRNIDVLLIDDIQWIEGKKRTQDEIFNTFDALHQAGKQVVFASDRPLSAFELIPDRIKSRFKWGIEAGITIPDLETRTKIISHHAKLSNFPISDVVAELLAKEFSTNIRELEGAYNKASTMASLDNTELTVENIKEYLNLNDKKKKITVNNILDTVAKYFSIEKEDILSNARGKEIVNARKYAIYLTRELLELSYPNLAIEFKKNHTTIMYQYDKMKKDIKTSKAMQIVVDEIKDLINRG
ncbi:MAG: chromosomal replication initiator protein DnaA [Candidatus Gastranaerophilales bacterium]|nr:chromosomal replication initiator protein DnaA [Candidatus Gastranaerophilales bacterium]